jgi:hypothetical protein
MGSGDRFTFGVTQSLGLGFYVSRWPFALTIDVQFTWLHVSIGFGKGYDEP